MVQSAQLLHYCKRAKVCNVLSGESMQDNQHSWVSLFLSIGFFSEFVNFSILNKYTNEYCRVYFALKCYTEIPVIEMYLIIDLYISYYSHWALHQLEYVLPSSPHTGAYVVETQLQNFLHSPTCATFVPLKMNKIIN